MRVERKQKFLLSFRNRPASKQQTSPIDHAMIYLLDILIYLRATAIVDYHFLSQFLWSSVIFHSPIKTSISQGFFHCDGASIDLINVSSQTFGREYVRWRICWIFVYIEIKKLASVTKDTIKEEQKLKENVANQDRLSDLASKAEPVVDFSVLLFLVMSAHIYRIF